MRNQGKVLHNPYQTGLSVLVVMAFLSLKFLLHDNMGGNEVDVLPLAKQYADPSWIPEDWYLNQPPGYRLLFETLFGGLIIDWGFLTISVVGRLLCNGLVALGLVLIGQKLGLKLPLLLLALSVSLLWRRQASDPLYWQHTARLELAKFTLMTLVPFILGLAVAPFDTEGRFLQYYPFRLGDVMLPLNTYLLLACALQQTFVLRGGRVLLLVCILLLSLRCSFQAVSFHEQFLALRQFPKLDSEAKDLYDWIHTFTPTDAIVVSPPVELVELTWLAERPTIAKFKLLPQTKAEILGWYERLSDLSGDLSPWPTQARIKDSRYEIEQALTTGYNHLTTAQADALMAKYRATYLITGIEHHLELTLAYRNSRYILYSQKTRLKNQEEERP
ncbi:MAG: DUF6798 domain-containing protein [Microcystaceae cyanobacterium]